MKIRRLARLPWPILLGLLFGLGLGGYLRWQQGRTITIPDVLPNIPVVEAPSTVPTPPAATVTIPASFTIEGVPFTPQAPFANWDELHNEACEEASVLMAQRYFDGERGGLIDPADADREIYDIVDWEKANLGKYLDTNAEETAQILSGKYGRKVRLSTTVTVNAVKKEIAANHLVIVPAAGRELPAHLRQRHVECAAHERCEKRAQRRDYQHRFSFVSFHTAPCAARRPDHPVSRTRRGGTG